MKPGAASVSVEAAPVGAVIENYPEHRDTPTDDDDAPLESSSSLWTEPRYEGEAGYLELHYLAGLLRCWLTHEPRPMHTDRSPLGGTDWIRAAFLESVERNTVFSAAGFADAMGPFARRRAVPLTPDQLVEELGFDSDESVGDVIRRLVTSRWYGCPR